MCMLPDEELDSSDYDSFIITAVKETGWAYCCLSVNKRIDLGPAVARFALKKVPYMRHWLPNSLADDSSQSSEVSSNKRSHFEKERQSIETDMGARTFEYHMCMPRQGMKSIYENDLDLD